MRRLALLLLGVLGCDSRAVGRGYRGEPLFTVKGQLQTAGAPPAGPLRLALAWYPEQERASAPRALVTQDVVYEGSFPLNYTFNLYSVPPAGVLRDYPGPGGTVTKAAFGVLLAYEDLNRNGQLDTTPPGAAPVDRVLGTSVGDTWNGAPAPAPTWLAYVEGTPGPDWVGFQPGYALWQRSGVIPAESLVPVTLAPTNELNLFVCEEFISGATPVSELPCRLPPTGGVRVVGSLWTDEGVPGVSLLITDGARLVTDVSVEVNGVAVAFEARLGLFSASPLPVKAPGLNEVRVTPRGQPPIVFPLEVPGAFRLEAPRDGDRVLAGSSLTARWTASARASFYQVDGYTLEAPSEALGEATFVTEFGQPERSQTVRGFSRDVLHQVRVIAFAPRYLAYGRGGSVVQAFVSQSAYVDVRPRDVGLWLEGTATIGTAEGQTGASVWVQALDGVELAPDALVTADGEALPFVESERLHGGGVLLTPERPVRLAVSRGGRRATFEVAMPGDFTVTRVPPSHPAGQPLRLTWSASVGADSYQVLVTDLTGRAVQEQRSVAETQAELQFSSPGPVLVTIRALRQSGRHLVGVVQSSWQVDVQP